MSVLTKLLNAFFRSIIMLSRLILIVFLSSLYACSSDSDDAAVEELSLPPEISAAYGELMHSELTHEGRTFLGFWVNVTLGISDPDGLSDIEDIYLLNEVDGTEIDVYGGDKEVPLEQYFDFYNREFDVGFSCECDHLNVFGWKAIVVDKSDNQVELPVTFIMPSGQMAGESDYIYSTDYDNSSGSIVGEEGLEYLTTTTNQLAFSSNIRNGSFLVSFLTNDARAKFYAFEFYGPPPRYELVGWTYFGSNSSLNNPLLVSSLMEVEVPLYEIYFNVNKNVKDIVSARIFLATDFLDHPIAETRYKWHANRSRSGLIGID